jgi:hypothetical protein
MGEGWGEGRFTEGAGDGWSEVCIGPGNFGWLDERLSLRLNSLHRVPIFQECADEFLQDATDAG